MLGATPIKCPSCGANVGYNPSDDTVCGRIVYKCKFCRTWCIYDFKVNDGEIKTINEEHADGDWLDIFMSRLFDGDYMEVKDVKD